MGGENNSITYLGFVPGRRSIGVAVLDKAGLQHCAVKSLKRYKTETDKLLAARVFLKELIGRYRPEAIISLKLAPQRATDFNLQLVTALKDLTENLGYFCPIYAFGLSEIKKAIGENNELKNQRQLSQTLSEKYPELLRYLSSECTAVITAKEKYYQPLFLAIGLAYSYTKMLEKINAADQNQNTNPTTELP